jgi:HPt (histidine-containing phosphotransfer) domain-containing protein
MAISLDTGAVTALLESVGNDREFLGELVGTFLDQSAGQFAELQAAAARGDIAEVRRSAHTLKANAATFGITDLERASRELEGRAHAGDLAGTEPLVTSIGDALAEARPALESLRAGGTI